jgi:hypothetical protein
MIARFKEMVIVILGVILMLPAVILYPIVYILFNKSTIDYVSIMFTEKRIP